MKVTINGKIVEAKEGETILSVAERNGFEIPTLCFHSDVKIGASCRICVVKVNEKMVPSCSTKVKEGMDIVISNEEIEKARKINLELLFSQHQEECFDCIWNTNCKMLELAKKYNVQINRFEDRKKNYPVYKFGPSLEFDSSKCIDCRNCIDICKKQGVEYLEIKGKGHLFEVIPSQKENKECVYCGQCIIHCPAGAFEAVGEFEDIENPFKDEKKTVIFQIAPSVRSTIGEEFGFEYGTVSTKKLVSSLFKLGAEKVFDVSTGADFTTIEESKEFLERVTKNDLPMLTSCCPAWVRFVEFYYPEFIPNLTTVRSPHIILGGVIKKYYSLKENIDPEKIMVVSIMPCVAKKYEIEREELHYNGIRPVDYVMTTREVGRLLKKNKIDFTNIEERELDNPFGEPSGSGVTYGASGGVMQSAFYNISGEMAVFEKINNGLKVANVEFNGKKLKLAVVHGLGNAKKVLEELKINPKKYDYVEVMACYGGCIGGGGQSVPTEEKIRQKRKEGLCNASNEKEIQKASDNLHVKKAYEDFLSDEDVLKLCYTRFSQAKKNKKS
jgi:NADP-reducing hydrogenase subunit HndD